MKTVRLILAIYLFGISSLSWSQTPINVSFDFRTRTFTNLDALNNLPNGGFYQLTINNINLNLYKVSLEKSDSTITSNISTPDFTLFSLDNIKSLVSSLASGSQLASLVQENSSGPLNFISQTHPISKSISKPTQDIIDRMTSEKNYLLSKEIELNAFKKSIDSLYFSVYNYLLLSKIEFMDSRFSCIDTTLMICKIIPKIWSLREELSKIKLEISAKQKDYNKFSEANKEIISKQFSVNDEAIKHTYVSMLETISKGEESVSADKSNQLVSSIITQENNRSNTYVSLPQQFNGDIGKLKITIEPFNSSLPLQKYSTELMFPPVNNCYSGVGFSFYYSGLADEAYSIKEIATSDTTSEFQLVDEKRGNNEIGSTLLLRYGFKFKEHPTFGIHFTFGPGVSISENIKPRLLLGGGLSLGKKHMFVIDIGGIAGYTERLSKVYSLDGAYSKKPERTTVSVIKLNGFISFGYLFKLNQR